MKKSMFPTARPRKVPKSPPRLVPIPREAIHVFRRSAHTLPGLNAEPLCDDCGNPQSHRVHDVAESPPEAAEIEARRLGEELDD